MLWWPVHGGNIFALPARFERSFHADMHRSNRKGLKGQYAAKITGNEVRDVLARKLPDGSQIPVYPFAEFKRGISDLPMRYAVVLDFEMAIKAKRGYESFEVMKDQPNMIIRARGVEPPPAYLDKFRDRNNTKSMGNWHPYNRVDPRQPQTRIRFLAGIMSQSRRGMCPRVGNIWTSKFACFYLQQTPTTRIRPGINCV